MTHEPMIDRRTVLKTTGAVLGGTALVASPVSANECRETAYDVAIHTNPGINEEGCIGEQTGTVPAGTTGKVHEWCGYYGWFEYRHNGNTGGWVHEHALDECFS